MSAEWKSVFQQRINELYQRAKDRDYTLNHANLFCHIDGHGAVSRWAASGTFAQT